MLICDLIAAMSTMAVWALIKTDSLNAGYLYLINAMNGLMNTVQQPAGEVAATLLIPKEYYQKTSGLRSFSSSLNSILTPILATALFSFAGMEAVIMVDMGTFLLAFVTLGLFIHIPERKKSDRTEEDLLTSARKGLAWLKHNELISVLILFLACINLVASVYDAALPAMILSKSVGGETVLGAVNTCVGAAMLLGSLIVTLLPAPKDRVKVICATLFVSMSVENFLLAFGKTPILWCIGAVIGWLPIPLMNANMDVIFRHSIPADMQGRVYSCRNTLQFFTIPIGFASGGLLVDKVFEPFMSEQGRNPLLIACFGDGKGSGAAMLFFVIGMIGVMTCVFFTVKLSKYKWNDKMMTDNSSN